MFYEYFVDFYFYISKHSDYFFLVITTNKVVKGNLRFHRFKFVTVKQTSGFLITRLICNPNKFFIIENTFHSFRIYVFCPLLCFTYKIISRFSNLCSCRSSFLFFACLVTTEAMRICGLRELHFRKAKK